MDKATRFMNCDLKIMELTKRYPDRYRIVVNGKREVLELEDLLVRRLWQRSLSGWYYCGQRR